MYVQVQAFLSTLHGFTNNILFWKTVFPRLLYANSQRRAIQRENLLGPVLSPGRNDVIYLDAERFRAYATEALGFMGLGNV